MTRGLTPVHRFHSFLSSGHTYRHVSRINFFFASSVSPSVVFVNLSWNDDEPDFVALVLTLCDGKRLNGVKNGDDGLAPLTNRLFDFNNMVRHANDMLRFLCMRPASP